uniref:MORN repeat-containing protein 4 homolog n=1 Tax=Drosophila melanogaster TaxID=7227 RepID=MORN4_DROME|eukprot:NP_649520.1 retinophilin [Drosophila melanogaster]
MAMDDYDDDMSSVGVTTARIENQHQQHPHQQGQHGHHQQGQGQSQYSAGAVKVGGWRYEDASRYIGEWNQRGQKHGIGHLQFADGTRYDGQFQEGLSQGVGCLWFADGAKYEGEFHQGWFHGNGIFWRADGMKYEGEFRGGKIWGLGLLTFQDFTHGFPRNEGFFQDCRFMRRRRCPEVVQRAQKCALMARSQCEHPY